MWETLRKLLEKLDDVNEFVRYLYYDNSHDRLKHLLEIRDGSIYS